MKKRVFAWVMAVLLTLSIVLPAAAQTGTLKTNTGKRHVVCTALSAQAKAYYTGSYTYDNLSTLQGGTENCLTSVDSPLFRQLHNLMANTMTASVSYKSLTSYWPDTDANNGSSDACLFYSDEISSSYNREHVWPKSRASFKQSDGGCDLHHLRPTNSTINSTRSNYTMGNVRGVISNYSTKSYNGKDVLYYSAANDLVEVNDNIKGDVARIYLYVYTRWEEPNIFMNDPNPVVGPNDDKNNGLKVIESMETLLEWCKLDPVDDWEMGRNDQCENVQGNRNVFIDYPEYAWLLFGQEIPTDMETPSGIAKSGTTVVPTTPTVEPTEPTVEPTEPTVEPTAPTVEPTEPTVEPTEPVVEPTEAHTHSYTASVTAPTCLMKGYTTYSCACGESYRSNFTDTIDHNYTSAITLAPTATTAGETTYTCTVCGTSYTEAIPATGDGEEPTEPTEDPLKDFTDLPEGAWYEEGVRYALENGLMNGVGDNKFEPDETLTRAMLVTILYRAENTPDVTGLANPFTDVPSGEWYTDAVIWAADNGIVKGMTETTFEPMTAITREQMATILYRYAGSPEAEETDLNDFIDGANVQSYAVEAMQWAVAEGIIGGTEENGQIFLDPQGNATRAQTATILMRYLENNE